MESPLPPCEPPIDCQRCARLAAERQANRQAFPDWWNAPVPALGDPDAWLAIVGLAPGKHGANRTGRAFTGDAAGELLWTTLAKFGLADEGQLSDGVIILNAVKCLPPGNKPTPEEIRSCRPYLESALAALPRLSVIVALGEIAHQSAIKAMGAKLPKHRFAHGACHRMLDGRMLIDSYHCSRYNQNTGRLTAEMFEDVFARALGHRCGSDQPKAAKASEVTKSG
jgi:uracil-DNA glycosylase